MSYLRARADREQNLFALRYRRLLVRSLADLDAIAPSANVKQPSS